MHQNSNSGHVTSEEMIKGNSFFYVYLLNFYKTNKKQIQCSDQELNPSANADGSI